jgi:RND family efflux transporter MFP subunit
MAQQGFVTQAQKTADQDSARKSEYAYQLAKTQIQVLSEFTNRKSEIELEAAIKKAVSDEMSKRAVLGLEKTKLQKIQTQIEKCKFYAPTGGLLVYANKSNQRPGGNNSMIEEGASVRERQALVQIADGSQLCVNAKVDETEISRITPGLKARVVVDALPGSALVGTVTKVEGMADLNQNNMQPEARFYTTRIEIENPPPSLRPGMATKVEILVRQVNDVIAVPPDAVLHYGGGSHVYVNSPEGLYLRNVELGTRTKSAIEITGGLFEGEMISLRPLDHMTPDEKRDAFLTGALAHEDHWLNAQSNH